MPGLVKKTLLSGAFALAMSSCISDGPNQTGGEYLATHGILLQDSLLHVSLKGIPADTFWTTYDAPSRIREDLDRLGGEPSHLGDTILLAGRSGGFTSEPRMSFQISDTSMLDSLVPGDSSSLRLTLAFPRPSFGLEELKASVEKAGSRDSIGFEVSSWDSTDAGLTEDAWKTRVAVLTRTFLYRQDTSGALPAPTAKDTIYLRSKTAYSDTGDAIQARTLPGLFRQLLKAPANKHLVHLRLTYLPAPGPDSGAVMLRLGGQLGDNAGLANGPLLLFGKTASAKGGNSKNRLQTQAIGSLRGVNYRLRYAGPPENMLTANLRGLHVVLDRARLLDSIDAFLVRNHMPVHPRSGESDFDLSYFVPFAKITLPVDTPTLEGGFPLEMRMVTAIDSLLGDTVKGGVRIDEVPSGSSKVLWYTFEPGHPENILDNVSISYVTRDSDLRQVILSFSRDSSRNDSIYIRRGETKEMNTGLGGYGSSRLMMTLEAGSSSLTVRSYLTVRPEFEKNAFKDPATGETVNDLIKLLPHYLKPGDTSITLRATHGFQRLLNRARTGTNILQDFEFRPASPSAVDTSVDKSGTNVPDKVPYPVLSVIPPKLNAGLLQVDVDMYLYPLKAR